MYLELDGTGIPPEAKSRSVDVERRSDGWYFLGDNIGHSVDGYCGKNSVPLKDGTK